MALGTVKWFSDTKGYGFIAQDNGKECYVHFSHIQGVGYRTLHEGDRVEFREVGSDRGKEAADVTRI